MKNVLAFAASLVFCIAFVACSPQKKLAKQRNDLKDTYETLKREMPEAQVTMDGDRVKVILPEAVLFAVNSAEMNKSYFPILAKMANVLNKYDKTSILITGYTDATGSNALNEQLSAKRAENAKVVMTDNKVKASRIYTWGLGAKEPIADNKTEEGRKQNRRVEYVIMYDYKDTKK